MPSIELKLSEFEFWNTDDPLFYFNFAFVNFDCCLILLLGFKKFEELIEAPLSTPELGPID